MPRALVLFVITALIYTNVQAQSPDNSSFKLKLEQAPDPLAYVKKTKKKWRLDTVVITSNKQFFRVKDSIGYAGKIKKVYGPFPGDSSLLQVLAKAPNLFYRVSHILLDTPKLNISVAKKLADTILSRIKRKETSFEDMARIYNTDGSGPIGGDLGWRARGTLIPALENVILKKKKGEIVKVWSMYGLHIIKITQAPMQDTGFAILLSVIP